jgi:SWI/SNF-related matrix-associated actin-dependent regulator 1 of chromatin subfamily A
MSLSKRRTSASPSLVCGAAAAAVAAAAAEAEAEAAAEEAAAGAEEADDAAAAALGAVAEAEVALGKAADETGGTNGSGSGGDRADAALRLLPATGSIAGVCSRAA